MIYVVEKFYVLRRTWARVFLGCKLFVWRCQILIISIVVVVIDSIQNQTISILGFLSCPGFLSFIEVSPHTIVMPWFLVVIIVSRLSLLSLSPSQPWQLWASTAASTLPVAALTAFTLQVKNCGGYNRDKQNAAQDNVKVLHGFGIIIQNFLDCLHDLIFLETDIVNQICLKVIVSSSSVQ